MIAVLTEATSAEDDAELALRASTGDRAAFGELYDRHAGRIIGFMRNRLRSAEDAEDLTHVVFLKAWKAMPQFRSGDAPFFAWLLVIAANTAASAFRRQRRLPTVALDPDRDSATNSAWEDRTVERLDTHAWLRKALPRLRPIQRRVLILRFAEDLDHAEVGQRINRSAGAVRVIQHRALLALRDLHPQS